MKAVLRVGNDRPEDPVVVGWRRRSLELRFSARVKQAHTAGDGLEKVAQFGAGVDDDVKGNDGRGAGGLAQHGKLMGAFEGLELSLFGRHFGRPVREGRAIGGRTGRVGGGSRQAPQGPTRRRDTAGHGPELEQTAP